MLEIENNNSQRKEVILEIKTQIMECKNKTNQFLNSFYTSSFIKKRRISQKY